MSEMVPVDRPNRARALEALERLRGKSAAAESMAAGNSGPAIAATTAAAVKEAIAGIGARGTFKADLEVQHLDQHGAKTSARLSFTSWGTK